MLRPNTRRIDLEKVYARQVKPELTAEEATAMEKALAYKPYKALFTPVAGKVHWYLLSAPLSAAGKCFGVADSWQEAEEAIHRLLCPTVTGRLA